MALTFYYASRSTGSITAAVIAELGIPCERVKLDLSAGDTKKDAFLKINPNGCVPAIVHDGTPIWESSVIAMYLGEVFGVDAKLYPPLGPKRGEAMKWITWTNIVLAEAATRLAKAMRPGSADGVQENAADSVERQKRSTEAAERARQDIAGAIKILDNGLEGRPFLLNEYTITDTHVHGFVAFVGMLGIDMKPFPNVEHWLQRCGDRPAIKGVMEG